MLVIFLVLVQFCAVFSQSGNQFISYHVYGDGQTSSACYPSLPASNWAGYITANTFGLACGTCVKMTSVATSKYIYAYAIDIGGRGFDLNLPAFCELCGENPDAGFASGGCNINWQVVDKSLCSSWIAGKTKPNCNLCPSGSTCNNPDPNRNGGVDWNTYCPSVISLGSGITMKRCEMRIDGCNCYGGSNPVTPPTKPPVTPPVAPKAPTGSGGNGKTSTRCGANWNAANTGCGNDCVDNSACTGSDTCFASLDMTPCGSTHPTTPPVAPVTPPKAPVTPPKAPTAPPSSPKGKTKTRCGANWSAANSGCGNDCTDNSACTGSNTCFADLDMTPCGASGLIADESSMTDTSDSKGMLIGISVGSGLLLLTVIVIAILMLKKRRMEEIV